MNHSVSRLVVVVPVFNEQVDVLEKVLKELEGFLYDVILVDDGSVVPVQTENPAVKCIIRHSRNKGQGAALNSGTQKAREMGYDHCAHFDGDGQHYAADLQLMLNEMDKGEADILLGSRFLKTESNQNIPLTKKMVLKGGVLLNLLLSGIRLTDSNCGIRMLNRVAMEKLVFRAERMAHASELLWLIRRSGLRFREFPVQVQYTVYSMQKGQNLYRIFPVTWEVLKAYFKYRFGR